jgi:hypothetical protein
LLSPLLALSPPYHPSLPTPPSSFHAPVTLTPTRAGNLRSAVRMGVASYNLVLEPDTNTLGHTQWFFFRVRGMVPGLRYTFTIVNLEKPSSLFNEGMRPLMYLSSSPGVCSCVGARACACVCGHVCVRACACVFLPVSSCVCVHECTRAPPCTHEGACVCFAWLPCLCMDACRYVHCLACSIYGRWCTGACGHVCCSCPLSPSEPSLTRLYPTPLPPLPTPAHPTPREPVPEVPSAPGVDGSRRWSSPAPPPPSVPLPSSSPPGVPTVFWPPLAPGDGWRRCGEDVCYFPNK